MQRCVERQRRMTFRQNEPVAFRIVGPVASQGAPVQRRDNVGDRQARTDVSHAGVPGRIENEPSDGSRNTRHPWRDLDRQGRSRRRDRRPATKEINESSNITRCGRE
jgi:hypothetical protein